MVIRQTSKYSNVPTGVLRMSTQRKALLRWAGSKRAVLDKLRELTPIHYDTYCEPFVGSGVMFFALSPKDAQLADLNLPLINFYEWVQKAPSELYDLVATWDRTKEQYLYIRSCFETDGRDLIHAAHFYFLNQNCFNGIYRTNLSGKFNVPFASNGTPKMPEKTEFLRLAGRSKNAQFTQNDFRETISNNLNKKSFFYIDPPYYVNDKRVFREYGPKFFGKEDLDDLSNILDDIDRNDSKFLVSYEDCTIAREIFKRWDIRTLSLTRNVGGFKSSRKTATELVIRNFS